MTKDRRSLRVALRVAKAEHRVCGTSPGGTKNFGGVDSKEKREGTIF